MAKKKETKKVEVEEPQVKETVVETAPVVTQTTQRVSLVAKRIKYG